MSRTLKKEKKESRLERCNKNHNGSSASLQIEGVRRIFHRSANKHSLQSTWYIADADSKAYAAVETVYDGIHVEEEESVGHLQKGVGMSLLKCFCWFMFWSFVFMML